MNKLIEFWDGHGTKILGNLTSIIAGAIVIPDFIPAGHVKYWAFANVVFGALTVRRGFTNSNQDKP